MNILRDGSLEPVRDGKVLIGVFPLKLGGASHAQHNTHVDTHSGEDSPPLFPAPEAVWAGNYTLVQKLDHPGPHIVRVALLELGGKKFNPPGALEFRLNVAPAPGINWSFLMLLLTASAIGGGGLYWVMVRSRPGVEWNVPFNLLDIGWLNRFVRWKGFLPVLQIPVLILTLVIMLLGFSTLHFFEHTMVEHFHFGEETHRVTTAVSMSALAGLLMHTFVDGVAIAAGFAVGTTTTTAALSTGVNEVVTPFPAARLVPDAELINVFAISAVTFAPDPSVYRNSNAFAPV